jgi:hypothetical protein
MQDEMREHIRRKEEACEAARAGKPLPQQPAKKYWRETEEKEGN